MPSKSADRAAEFNRLLVEQGLAIRDMKYDDGKPPSPEEKATLDARAARLHELAELMGVGGASGYINERLTAWMRMNPLPLSMQRVRDALVEHPLYSLEGDVYVSIGHLDKGGYRYRVMADDFAWSGARIEGVCSHDPTHEHNDADCDDQVVRGDMVLRVPDSVAEHFRQQGKRQLMREHARLMGLASKV